MQQKEQRLSSSESDTLPLLSEVVAGMSDPAILLDRHLRPLAYNYRFYDLTGQRKHLLERHVRNGESLFDLVSASSDRDTENANQCIETGRAMHLAEVVVRNQAGDSFVMLQSFIPVPDTNGAVAGLIVVFRDTSGEARMHESYKKLLAKEKARAERLEAVVEQRTCELRQALEEVTRLSRTDPLTGVLNRRAFSEYAEELLDLARRHDHPTGLLMCDLDHFKRVNDVLGHQAGDAVLVETAKALKKATRATDRIARFGGEEFVVFMPETPLDALNSVAQRCVAAVGALALDKSKSPASVVQPKISISIGAAVFPQHAHDLDGLIKCADQAMYKAKHAGRNRAVVFRYEPRIVPVQKQGDRRRVLLVDTNEERARQGADCLEGGFDVVVAHSGTRGIAHCEQEHFDVVIGDQDVGTMSGGGFLTDVSALLPDAYRILMVDDEGQVLWEMRRSELGFDGFVLRRFSLTHLREVVEDGLLKKELAVGTGTETSPRLLAVSKSFLRDMLAQVISDKTLEMHYQPIVDSYSSRPLGYEALCRPQHEHFSRPTDLFRIAHKMRLVWPLGRLIRAMVFADVQRLPPGRQVFINLHPAEIEDPRLVEESPYAADHALKIVYEITERAAIRDLPRVKDNVRQLRAKGYSFAIDDLGAGYASLSSVALIGPDYVKIDRVLMDGIEQSSIKRRIIQTIVDFAGAEGMRVIAEGVETPEQADVVRDIGCHYMQGYLHGRPAPVTAWIDHDTQGGLQSAEEPVHVDKPEREC